MSDYVLMAGPTFKDTNMGYLGVYRACSESHFRKVDLGWDELGSGTKNQMEVLLEHYQKLKPVDYDTIWFWCEKTKTLSSTTEKLLREIEKYEPNWLDDKVFLGQSPDYKP